MLSKDLFTEDNFDAALVAAVGARLDHGAYSDAVLAGARCLTAKLREVSGQDGDGAQLAGQVLGGNAPLFRLNNLSTTSEKDEQKGIEQYIRGIYIGIRNPRTHETISDNEDHALRILTAIDLALSYLNRPAPQFDIAAFVDRIYDAHFVPSQEYAEILLEDVPENSTLLVFRAALSRYQESDSEDLENIFRSLQQLMTEDELREAASAFSVELRKELTDAEFASVFRLMKPEAWIHLDDDVRIRLENLIIERCHAGTVDARSNRVQHGLGSFGKRFGRYFDRRRDLAETLIEKLTPDWYTQNYVGKYFMSVLPSLVDDDLIEDAAHGLAYAALTNRAIILRRRLGEVIANYPEAWQNALAQEIQEREDDNPELAEELLQLIG